MPDLPINKEALREKLHSTYLDYGNDLIVSGGKLEPHVDEAMTLIDSYAASLVEENRVEQQLSAELVKLSNNGYLTSAGQDYAERRLEGLNGQN